MIKLILGVGVAATPLGFSVDVCGVSQEDFYGAAMIEPGRDVQGSLAGLAVRVYYCAMR